MGPMYSMECDLPRCNGKPCESTSFDENCGMLNMEDYNKWGSITKWGQCTLWSVICLDGMGNLVNQLALMKIVVC
jgi:hypothetical protein